jgi:hypothetical protein
MFYDLICHTLEISGIVFLLINQYKKPIIKSNNTVFKQLLPKNFNKSVTKPPPEIKKEIIIDNNPSFSKNFRGRSSYDVPKL